MKRYNNLFEKIATIENIELADKRARKHKSHTFEVLVHDIVKDYDNLLLLLSFLDGTYKTSKYKAFKIYEPKERIIFKLPYYPDRIAHHAVMNILESIWVNIFIKNTYSCIKNRGIHRLRSDLYKDLRKNPDETKYCLKFDIKKFYPSIDLSILKRIIRKKIKDKKLLNLLDEIIDSQNINNINVGKLKVEESLLKGVPIGNYLSLFFANLYLTYFDHWVKEELLCKFYYRYADDIVILHDDKNYLRNILTAIKLYLKYELNLKLKDNYLIFNVDSRGIDFVGYVFRHNYIKLRKLIKQRIKRCLKTNDDKLEKSMASYRGWLKYCNSNHFCYKYSI